MNIELSNLGRIKIILNTYDLFTLGISFSTLSQPSAKSGIILYALFIAASQKLNQNNKTTELLIEAYPHINGGGVLYFTPLVNTKRKSICVKKANNLYAFDFYDGSNLLKVIELLYQNKSTRQTASTVYDIDGVFRLVTQNFFDAGEFCDYTCPFNKVKKYTCEHGKVLTGDNAIYEIGTKLTRPLAPLPPI